MKITDSMLIAKSVKLDRSPTGPLTITIARNNMMPQIPDGGTVNAVITVDISVSQTQDSGIVHIGEAQVKYLFAVQLDDTPYEIQSCAEQVFAASRTLFFAAINSLLTDVRLPPVRITQLDTGRA